jgi:signal transduction histidine kinase
MFAVCPKNAPRHFSVHTPAPVTGCADPGAEDVGARDDPWLATLAHELREPLATITFALAVISGDQTLDASSRQACDGAERQVRKALQLVDDFLDVCAGARETLALRKEVVDLTVLVTGAVETVRPLFTERGHRLTVALPSEPVTLFADALRLEQVLTNLLTNAAKFTDPGGDIRLAAEGHAGAIVLRVRDSGRGIPPDLLPRVFDLFQQGSGAEAPRGLGIGLALVKYLVALHGGTVTASSAGPDTGSEFVVSLPARSA